ncbi:hypothetical protein HX037_01645 [Ignatzschineria indica]|uniref:hypothetical protein n=1 Tax=Ignatzschineria indica TaxID=472583 RepID=UPI0025765424|nr:hypothetical protein [Ignatzschineria indica]MDM1544592.1 hypothetical protein [Ignatzschineria indica]
MILAACNFWKNAVVISGNSLTFVVLINKKDYGRAGTDHFVLFTGACQQVGIDDAEKIVLN